MTILRSFSFIGSILDSALITTRMPQCEMPQCEIKWAKFMACLCNFNLKPFSIFHPKAGTRTLITIINGFQKSNSEGNILIGKHF